MDKKRLREKPEDRVWRDFVEEENLSSEQLEQFKTYARMLQEWNELCNLTAIKDLSGIVNQHFIDSIALRKKVDLGGMKTICDVGAGAGFPGLPLKIVFPDVNLILIEVKQKKRDFLNNVIERLGLQNVEVVDLDWRTFLRTTEGSIDLFVTKAALPDVELIRLFRANCSYRNADLIYWASDLWEVDPKAEEYVKEVIPYQFKRRERRFVRFSLTKS